MKFKVPLRLPSLANTRMSWQAMARLKRKQKDTTALAMRAVGGVTPTPPLVVTITRVGPRKLDDDNLAGACKYVRDAIANCIGLDDGSDLYTWVYRQRIGPYSVEVEIIER